MRSSRTLCCDMQHPQCVYIIRVNSGSRDQKYTNNDEDYSSADRHVSQIEP